MRSTVYLLPLFVLAACSGGGSSGPDAGPDAGDTDTGDPVPLTAVDLLVVIDNTAGSSEEEPILAAGLYGFASALLDPPPSSTYPAVDDLRVAAITTNMGLSADGESMDDYWPDNVPSECSGLGGNGRFQDISTASVEFPDGGSVDCPALGTAWAETSADSPNADLPAQAACLAMQGTGGCGWDQQLQSAATALARGDQKEFIRDDAVLAIVVAANEDDCSLENGPAMFAEDEIADDYTKWNLACGEHEEHLFTPEYFYETFAAARGRADAVVFVGVVGVPYAEQTGAAACQGYGDQLGDCLDQGEMQLVPEESESGTWYFRRACTRSEGDVQVTDAWPGRRFVDLANGYFGADSYIYSHCNADWTPAFDALSMMIAGKLAP